MTESEIEHIMDMVRETAVERHPWISDLRYASDDEFEAAKRVCEMHPCADVIADSTVTVVLHG